MLETRTIEVRVADAPFAIAYTDTDPDRRFDRTPVLYFHGWGCSKADFAGAATYDESLAGRRLVAFDMPGCGESPPAPFQLSLPHLTLLTQGVADRLSLNGSAVVGHSYGGATAVEYAQAIPEQVAGIVNVMGNMQRTDCFMTSKVAAETLKPFLRHGFRAKVDEWANSGDPGLQRYAEGLRGYTEAQTREYHAYARMAIEHSDTGDLLRKFLKWPGKKIFIHGEREQAVYLDAIKDAGIPVGMVPDADHFPFVDNPQEYYRQIGAFMRALDA